MIASEEFEAYLERTVRVTGQTLDDIRNNALSKEVQKYYEEIDDRYETNVTQSTYTPSGCCS